MEPETETEEQNQPKEVGASGDLILSEHPWEPIYPIDKLSCTTDMLLSYRLQYRAAGFGFVSCSYWVVVGVIRPTNKSEH